MLQCSTDRDEAKHHVDVDACNSTAADLQLIQSQLQPKSHTAEFLKKGSSAGCHRAVIPQEYLNL